MAMFSVQDLVERLGEELSQTRMWDLPFLNPSAVRALLARDQWEQRLGALAQQQRRYTCSEILEMSRESMARLCQQEPEEGWLLYTYRFLSHYLFPDADFTPRVQPYYRGAQFYICVLRVCLDWENYHNPHEPMWEFDELAPGEYCHEACGEEYRSMMEGLRRHYYYEMMRIGMEATPFQTLTHIAGVHHVAVTVARQLKQAGQDIDVSQVAGAAMCHDIGKFGCRPKESRRVAHLHYYYTDQWCQHHGYERIGYVAANHSTWDLELDNLSIESLVLIYADFRVREDPTPEGKRRMKICTLDDAFDAILSKLENMDEKKLRRYRYVYAKLQDFERYIIHVGVDVTLSGAPLQPRPYEEATLLDTERVVEQLRLLSVEHNLMLMHRLSSQELFAKILEAMYSEKNWRSIRAYLDIFEEYSIYLPLRQKEHTLGVLYELTVYREGDIRRQAARLMGYIIANYRAGYVKEKPEDVEKDPNEVTPFSLWKQYLPQFIDPGYRFADQQRSWIGYTLKHFVMSLLESCESDQRGRFLRAFHPYFRHPEGAQRKEDSTFVLLDSALYFPYELCSRDFLIDMTDFALYQLDHLSARIVLAALRLLAAMAEKKHLPKESHARVRRAVEKLGVSDKACQNYLCRQILIGVGVKRQDIALPEWHEDMMAGIFLENLKTATAWVDKAVNIEMLCRFSRRSRSRSLLHIATHFSNLIKVSERVVIRHMAGDGLLAIVPRLRPDQRNEIAVELVKGLDVDKYEYSKYIPEYLGQLALWLPPEQFDEMIDNLRQLINGANSRAATAALHTIGVILRGYGQYARRFGEENSRLRERYLFLVGRVTGALGDFREEFRQEAMLLLGKGLFGSSQLSEEEKGDQFLLLYKKFLCLLWEKQEESELSLYYRASSLRHVYRFIVRHELDVGEFAFERSARVAFFPGTFDPFTSSHEGIVTAIRDMGFEVYVAVDEFSWSKKTQPSLIRRRIITMSLADQFGVHVMPSNLPVNIANPDDLETLERIFADKELYIVVGSDVVANASSYRQPVRPHSIHHFNHIIFKRSGSHNSVATRQGMYDAIQGKIIELELPMYLEDISSTMIRENIDHNRDISNLIDPVAQQYIYSNSLYLHEPQYKTVLNTWGLELEEHVTPGQAVLDEIRATIWSHFPRREECLRQIAENGESLLLLRDFDRGGRILGFTIYKCLGSQQIREEFDSARMAAFVRMNAAMPLLRIAGVYVENPGRYEQMLLSETLALAAARDVAYAVYYSRQGHYPDEVCRVLELQGFLPPVEMNGQPPLFLVDMRYPVVLIHNIARSIKEPFASNERVRAMLDYAHQRLQKAMSRFYPGELLLSLDSDVLHNRLVKKITELNGVPSQPTRPRRLGENMCVPFGKILRGVVVPNTVTKTLHTEKVFEPDVKEFTIEAYPNYPALEHQVRILKSFSQPVLLVDDLLHKGHRLSVLNPLFAQQGVRIERIIVGLLSGRGQDLADDAGEKVETIYYVPNMRLWFVESSFYPFIGGDTVRRGHSQVPGMQPGVNLILPYAAPTFIKGARPEDVYHFSQVCIENARDILQVLEREYRMTFDRNLTLNRLGEVVQLPTYPDKGDCIAYDIHETPSAYLSTDLEMLRRLRESLV